MRDEKDDWLHGANFNKILLLLMAMFGFKLEMRRQHYIETPVDAAMGKVKKQHETLEFNFSKQTEGQ